MPLSELTQIESLLTHLNSSLGITFDDPDPYDEIFPLLQSSYLLSTYKDIKWYKAARIPGAKKGTRIMIAYVTYFMLSGKYGREFSEFQLMGIKSLDFNYGHLLIRPETLEDKVTEWFSKAEIDLPEHPHFSFKYYFLAEDQSLAHSFATPQRLDLLEQQHEILLEVKGNLLIAKYARVITAEDCQSLAEFIRDI